MNRILVATDGSEDADRAVDYAARRAKDAGAELLIVNVVGGYGLPDKVLMAFTNDQSVLLKELLESQSAQTLTAARDRARKAGAGTILLEFADAAKSHKRSSRSRRKRRRTPLSSANGAPGASKELCWAVSRKNLLFFHLCR